MICWAWIKSMAFDQVSAPGEFAKNRYKDHWLIIKNAQPPNYFFKMAGVA
jgi:hypothetical protein